MSRKRTDRVILGMVAGLSLALTGLTILSVANQGRTLQEREWAELRRAAEREADEQRGLLESRLERVLEEAERVWFRDGAEGLDRWIQGEPWLFLLVESRYQRWLVFPRSAEPGGTAAWTLPGVSEEGREARLRAAARGLDGVAESAAREASRGALPGILAELEVARVQGVTRTGRRLTFLQPTPTPNPALVSALYGSSSGNRLALVVLAERALATYFGSGGEARPWEAVLPGAGRGRRVLAELGPAFGGARLVPTEATLGRLAARTRDRWLLVGAVAAGSITAWGVVIWLMLRVMERQRELIQIQRRFVADVSHELKTPLALIRLLGETLCDQRVRDPNRMREYHQTIVRESERLTVLLDSILDFSRIESGKKQYQFEDCDVGAIARQAWALFAPQFEADRFEHRLDVQADLPMVRADGQALQQLVVNLLQNAYRYGSEGKFVRLAVERRGYAMFIIVEDHGIGMSRTQLQRLGDSFYRAPDPRVRRTRGTGLGLAMVNHIIQAHRGKLEVHSRPGRGSTFTAWFPFEPERAGNE